MTAPGEWPSDQQICALASDETIPLFAEADKIARQYNLISQALAVRLLGTENLNWCGFAQWSSKAVGSDLRLGDNSGFLRKLTRLYHLPMLAEPLFRLIMLALLGGSYGVGLSTANRSIFVEMASFHTHLLSGAEEATIVQVIPPDPDRSLLTDLGEEGLGLLRTARSLLHESGSVSGPLRSELILGASIALSAYEQKRVQPALEYVFYRPVRWLLQVSWRMPYYYLTRRTDKRQKFYKRPHHRQTRVMQRIEDSWVRMNSKTLWLKTAVDTIMLSKPLTIPHGSSPSLLRAATTFESPEVAELVRRYGPPDPADLKGVSNWLDYQERMRFIVTYFMGYQQITQMFGAPRYKPKRSWLKPQTTEQLGELQFREVAL